MQRRSGGLGNILLHPQLAGWVCEAFANYQPSQDALDLVSPSSAELHEVFDREHAASTGLHNLRVVELTYQVTLEVGGDILLAAASNVGFETESSHEKYVSSALTGVDWVKGKNAYSGRFKASEEHAHAAVPNLQDGLSRKRAGSVFLAHLPRVSRRHQQGREGTEFSPSPSTRILKPASIPASSWRSVNSTPSAPPTCVVTEQ